MKARCGSGFHRSGSSWLSWLRLACLVMLVVGWLPLAQVASAQDIPAGFRLIAEQPGVALYRKDYAGGTPDYVQIVDLTAGASIDLLSGASVAVGNPHNLGMFGGPNPSFRQKAIRSFWNEYSSTQEGAFCVTNGQFFYMPESPTPLALPLLVDHQLLAEGFGYPQYPEKQLILALWADHADILPLTPESLAYTDAEQVIGGLTEEANKKPKNAVGRTFVGIWDKDGDQRYETVAIYTTQTATQPEAARTVRSFGATKVMMLDGGGSTQLICQGQTYIDTTRAIPQALGISAGPQASAAPSSSSIEVGEPVQSANDLSSASIENTQAVIPALPPPSQEITSAPPNAAELLVPPDPTLAERHLNGPAIQATTMVTAEPQSEPAQSKELVLVPAGPNESRPPASPSPTWSYSNAAQSSLSASANGLDVLWLPVIIPPLSIILIFVGRKQIFMLYREG